jgi:hypothetical protein
VAQLEGARYHPAMIPDQFNRRENATRQPLRRFRLKHMSRGRDFLVGDRVRLSELGIARSPKIKARSGVVVALARLNGNAIGVLIDGNKTVTTLHRSYLELEDAG